MDPTPQPALTTAQLVFLRRLVTTLTLTMITGMILIATMFVINFSKQRVGAVTNLALPDQIQLPDKARALSFTQAENWFAVVTTDNHILIFDRTSGQLKQTLLID